jgi:hypothetical protein
MASARSVGRAFFPLDEQLGLLPGALTPRLHERLVLLGTCLPSFQQAAHLLVTFTGVTVSEPTVRRTTERAGAVGERVAAREQQRLQRDLPPAPAGPAQQFLSVDGVFVPLVGGDWAEARTLVIGTVAERVGKDGVPEATCRDLSYFCRLTSAETFAEQALVEIHQRGVENAGEVGAVTDGALWCQGFVDLHCPDARRILDFPHAAQRLGEIGSLLWGEGTPAAQTWVSEQLHRLKHEGPGVVLDPLREQYQAVMPLLTPEVCARLAEQLSYLEKRTEQMQYPHYRAAGWPIGSGAVESGNKLVVQVRLKGPGMHWARQNVNPMLVLRSAYCSDRWAATWSAVAAELRQERSTQAARRRPPAAPPVPAAGSALPTPPPPAGPLPAPRPHPWRRINPNWLKPCPNEYAKL